MLYIKKDVPFKNVMENIDKVIKISEVPSARPYEWLE